jgi:hypothetical protein
VKLLDLIVHLVQHYNRIMGQWLSTNIQIPFPIPYDCCPLLCKEHLSQRTNLLEYNTNMNSTLNSQKVNKFIGLIRLYFWLYSA